MYISYGISTRHLNNTIVLFQLAKAGELLLNTFPIHTPTFVSMLHSPTLTASCSATAISTNEIAPEELIERVILQVFIEA